MKNGFFLYYGNPTNLLVWTRKILADAQQYSFNYLNLKSFTTLVMIGALHDTKGEHYYVFNRKGWAIILDQPDFVENIYLCIQNIGALGFLHSY